MNTQLKHSCCPNFSLRKQIETLSYLSISINRKLRLIREIDIKLTSKQSQLEKNRRQYLRKAQEFAKSAKQYYSSSSLKNKSQNSSQPAKPQLNINRQDLLKTKRTLSNEYQDILRLENQALSLAAEKVCIAECLQTQIHNHHSLLNSQCTKIEQDNHLEPNSLELARKQQEVFLRQQRHQQQQNTLRQNDSKTVDDKNLPKKKSLLNIKKSQNDVMKESKMNKADHSGIANQQQQEHQKYCYCNRQGYGEMVMCENEFCEKEWFHLECIFKRNQITEKLPQKWYCMNCEAQIQKTQGQKRQVYSYLTKSIRGQSKSTQG